MESWLQAATCPAAQDGDPKDVTDLVLDLLVGKLRRPVQREGMGFAREKGGAQESLTVSAHSRTYTSMRTSLNKS